MESERMRELIREAERDYDLVVIDAPPITTVSDAIPLLSQVSGVIVVSRIGSNTRPLMKRLSEQLRNLDAPVLGVVANFASLRDELYYGYGYGHAQAGKRQAAGSLPFKR
jgi:Mrp family chromosome partitioning ATPase